MALRVFLSYSHKDEELFEKLKAHLEIVERNGHAEFWDDSRLTAGTCLEPAIYSRLDDAHVILLLISADFLHSEFCYSKEMERALARQRAGTARVIPVILRDCQWKIDGRLAALTALPHDALPFTKWPNIDSACDNVVKGLFRVLDEMAANRAAPREVPAKPALAIRAVRKELPAKPALAIRAAKGKASAKPALAIAASGRTGQTVDRVRFLRDAHDLLACHFERELAALRTAHAALTTEFTRVDGSTFVCRAEPAGRRATECAISLVPDRGWITFSDVAASRGNLYIECLGAAVDERGVFLRCLGLGYGADPSRRLTPDDAATLLWNRFVAPLRA